ncbi:CBS domain-containing protein [Devosia sp. ZB163]|uniref:CBS domain-containing protein n=1 Tax=Devosia sp. ZB163 TaxID=3025938 RepID=UPI002362ED3D|nr:CBS domain-containing protein [Devosia sp. ZB163]MDC9824116.1 CBS domain-containing protein [Devosia sp. ZB163]
MKVSECMSDGVEICSPDDTIRDIARTMREIDVGAMPVGEDDRLVGMITDRDIAIRAIAEGMGPETRVRQVMSQHVRWCYEDEEIDDVADQMAEFKVRRLPVLNRDKRLIGVISLGDVSLADGMSSGRALHEISEPGGMHSQH